MKNLTNPFYLLGRILILIFKMSGYTITFFIQIIWYISYRRKDKIADAFGFWGRDVTKAISDVFQ